MKKNFLKGGALSVDKLIEERALNDCYRDGKNSDIGKNTFAFLCSFRYALTAPA